MNVVSRLNDAINSVWRWVRWPLVGLLLMMVGWASYSRLTTPPAAGWGGPARHKAALGRLAVALHRVPESVSKPRAGIVTTGMGVASPEYYRGAVPAIEDLRVVMRDVETAPAWVSRTHMETIASTALQMAEDGDLPRAVEYLMVAERLASRFPGGNLGSITRAMHTVLQEHDLPPELATRLIDFWQHELPMSVPDDALYTLGMWPNMDDYFDRVYTNDGDGNGWLVLSETAAIYRPNSPPRHSRNRVWNLLSPVFFSRSQAIAAVADPLARIQALEGLTADEAWAAGEKIDGDLGWRGSRRVPSETYLNADPRLGPAVGLIHAMHGGWLINGAINRVAQRRAQIVMTALSEHKYLHGAYPERLTDLARPLPLDLATQGPFDYRANSDGPDTYALLVDNSIERGGFFAFFADKDERRYNLPLHHLEQHR